MAAALIGFGHVARASSPVLRPDGPGQRPA